MQMYVGVQSFECITIESSQNCIHVHSVVSVLGHNFTRNTRKTHSTSKLHKSLPKRLTLIVRMLCVVGGGSSGSHCVTAIVQETTCSSLSLLQLLSLLSTFCHWQQDIRSVHPPPQTYTTPPLITVYSIHTYIHPMLRLIHM